MADVDVLGSLLDEMEGRASKAEKALPYPVDPLIARAVMTDVPRAIAAVRVALAEIEASAESGWDGCTCECERSSQKEQARIRAAILRALRGGTK